MDQHKLRERYLRDDWPIRLGNLASTLGRLSSAVSNPKTLTTVAAAVREGMLLIEWNLHQTPPEILIELASMQAELGLWASSWKEIGESTSLRALLSRRARDMSDRVLQLSGLLKQS
jgi:hypothetical protein